MEEVLTTIVGTRYALYGDSQCTNAPSFKTTKLAHVQCAKTGEEFLIGGCGYLSEFHFFARLLTEYGLENVWKLHLTEHWPPKIMKGADTDLLVLTRDKKLYLFDKTLVPMDINQDTYAMGSGAEYATAALALGKTAAEAVEFAAQHDPYTKGPVHELKFPRRKRDADVP